jgi:hypothetical protein
MTTWQRELKAIAAEVIKEMDPEDPVLSKTKLVNLVARNKLIILVEEEYGYRHWLWNPLMTTKELEQWWYDLVSVSSFYLNPGNTLPGNSIKLHFHEHLVLDGFAKKFPDKIQYFSHLHEDDDSELVRYSDKEILYHVNRRKIPYWLFGSDDGLILKNDRTQEIVLPPEGESWSVFSAEMHVKKILDGLFYKDHSCDDYAIAKAMDISMTEAVKLKKELARKVDGTLGKRNGKEES